MSSEQFAVVSAGQLPCEKPVLCSHGEPSSWVDSTCTPASQGAPLPSAQVAVQAQGTSAWLRLAEC